MIVGAVGDFHGRKYLDLARGSPRIGDADLILLAGDVTDGNDLEQFELVLEALRRETSAGIVAVFGNEEYEQSHLDYREKFDIIFLDDEAVVLEVGGLKVKVVGTTGSLDRPTWWQRTNLPDVWKRYQKRAERVSGLLSREGSDVLILLMHYAPTYRTLGGEKEERFAEMGSRRYERVIMEKAPDAVFHAHAHNGTRQAVLAEEQRSLEDFNEGARRIPVFNVSLPLDRSITIVEIGGRGSEGQAQS